MDTTTHDNSYMTPGLAAWRRWTDIPLLILAIGSLPILALELASDDLVDIDRTFLVITNMVVLAAFAIDYFVELWLARDRAAYARHEWTSALIVATQALAMIPALTPFGFTRVFRAGRALRIAVMALRVVAVGGVAAREGRRVLRRHAAAFALGLAGFTWVRLPSCSRSSKTSVVTAGSTRSSTPSGGPSPRSPPSATATSTP